MYNIYPIWSSDGTLNTPGAKKFTQSLRSLDNRNNPIQLVRAEAKIQGFTLEELRPKKVKKIFRPFADFFRNPEKLARREFVAERVNVYEKALKEFGIGGKLGAQAKARDVVNDFMTNFVHKKWGKPNLKLIMTRILKK
ncbi:MAG: hypothetical protein LBK53_06740 [Heliobacteriaceae bacterium]|nr:hypothetical protein [Heliobacteriaceae bacterium]